MDAYLALSLKERIYLNESRRNRFLGTAVPANQTPVVLSQQQICPSPVDITNNKHPQMLHQQPQSSQISHSSSSQQELRYTAPIKSHLDVDRFVERLIAENRAFLGLNEKAPTEASEARTSDEAKKSNREMSLEQVKSTFENILGNYWEKIETQLIAPIREDLKLLESKLNHIESKNELILQKISALNEQLKVEKLRSDHNEALRVECTEEGRRRKKKNAIVEKSTVDSAVSSSFAALLMTTNDEYEYIDKY